MKLVKSLSAFVAVAALAASSYAATAANGDLVLGFKSSAWTTDVVIDLGNVSNYTAPGTYTIGNFASQLTSTAAITWGAVADVSDITGTVSDVAYLSSKWLNATGTLGVANSTNWDGKSQDQINLVYAKAGNVYNGIGSYTVGVAKTIATSSANSWTKNDTSSSAFNFTSAQFNNTLSNLGGTNFSASDLYSVQNDGTTGTSTLVGTFAVFQNGDVTFTVIPEPSTYALILGAMTVGFVGLRRRFGRAV
jgi:hypothetical protein